MPHSCPFCKIVKNDTNGRMVCQNALAIAIRDGFPISEGHTLIIPRRHIPSIFEATDDERKAIWSLLEECKTKLIRSHQPNAYNIGINDGLAAGQTVPHVHIHFIPRYDGDVDDPRGGIRWIMPDKAKYW